MVQRRGGGARPTPRRAAHVTSAFAVFCLATLWCGAVTQAADGPIRLSEAAEQGTFNVGAARASVTREADPRGGGDLLKLDFTIPPGAAAGLYAKSFPGPMDGEHVDIVRMALKAQGTEPVRQVAAALEIKGAAGVQRIPLPIPPEGTPVEEALDWPAIGALREVVLSVSHTGEGGPATGTILIDGRFEQLSPVRKLGMLRWARAAGVLLASLLLAMLVGFLRSATRRSVARIGPALPVRPSWVQGLREDLVRGSGAVFMVLLALAIFQLGEQRPLDAGWTALEIAVAGMVHRGVVELRADGQVSDRPRGVPGCPGHRPAGRLREPHGDPPAARLLERAPPPESDGRGGHRAHLPRGQCSSDHFDRQALDGEGRGADRRHSLRLRQPGAAGTGRPAAAPGRRPPPRAWSRRTPPWWSSWDACSSSSASTRRWPPGWAWRPGAGRSGLPRAHLAMLAVAIAAVAGSVDRGPRVGSGRGLVDRRASAGRHRADDHALPGRAVGRGLPRHRMAMDAIHGQAPSRELGLRASRHGDEEGDGVQRGVHGEPVRPRCCSGKSRSSAGWARRFPMLCRHPCSERWPSRCSRRSSRRSTAARRSSGVLGGTTGSPLLFLRGAVVGLGLGYGADPAGCPRRTCRAAPGSASASVPWRMQASTSFAISSRRRGAAGGSSRRAITSCTRSWAASSARPSGSTSTPPRSPWSSPSSIATSPRGSRRELFDIYPLVSKWGHLDLGIGHRRREPAASRRRWRA